jgi:hypothetical protein
MKKFHFLFWFSSIRLPLPAWNMLDNICRAEDELASAMFFRRSGWNTFRMYKRTVWGREFTGYHYFIKQNEVD